MEVFGVVWGWKGMGSGVGRAGSVEEAPNVLPGPESPTWSFTGFYQQLHWCRSEESHWAGWRANVFVPQGDLWPVQFQQ